MNTHIIILYLVLIILLGTLFKTLAKRANLKILYLTSHRVQNVVLNDGPWVSYSIVNSREINVPVEQKTLEKAFLAANYGHQEFNEEKLRKLLELLGFENIIITPIKK